MTIFPLVYCLSCKILPLEKKKGAASQIDIHWIIHWTRLCSLQRTVEKLKVENNQLKTGTLSPCPSPGPTSSAPQSSGLAAAGPSSPRQSVAVHLPKSYSRGLSEGGGPGTVHSLNMFCSLHVI